MLTRTSEIMRVFEPWIAFSIVLFVLLRTQVWINRHLFGIGLLTTKEKGVATFLYMVFMLPGVILREGSRFLVAGIVRLKPAYITPLPEVGEDGVVNVRIVHFVTFNPVYAALIGAAPFATGLLLIMFIGNYMHIPALLTTLSTVSTTANGSAVFRDALLAFISRPDFPFFAYILFSVANTMLPTSHEFRATWIIWVIFGLFLGALAIIGLFYAIWAIFNGPVAQVVWLLTAVFTATCLVNLMAMLVIGVIEGIIGRLTNQKIQYRPAERAAAKAVTAPRSVYDLHFPIPPSVGKVTPLPVSATSAKLPGGTDRPGLPAPVTSDKPGLPDPSKRLPVKATSTIPAAPGASRAPEATPPSMPVPPKALPGSPAQLPSPAAEKTEKPAEAKPDLKPPPFAPAARQSGEVKAAPARNFGTPDESRTPSAPIKTTGEQKAPFASPAARQSGEVKAAPSSPFASPNKPDESKTPVKTTGEQKSPFASPAARQSGEVKAAPSSPFASPNKPDESKTPVKTTGEQKSPFASLAARQSGEVKAAPSSPFATPARQSGEQKPPSTPPKSGIFGGEKAADKPPVSGPPALTSGPKPVFKPPTTGDRPFKPAPKTGVFDKPRAEAQSPANRGDDDVIDADVVDEAERPEKGKSGGNKDVRYVNSDEA